MGTARSDLMDLDGSHLMDLYEVQPSDLNSAKEGKKCSGEFERVALLTRWYPFSPVQARHGLLDRADVPAQHTDQL